MKFWVLAGLFTAAAPFAAASEYDADCQLDETRRPQQQVRIDGGSPGGSAPPTRANPTSEQRANAEELADRQAAAAAAARAASADRRRDGKRIPDAVLIGPRGAL